MRSSFTSVVVAAALLAHSASAQQYAGETIPNKLPKLNNAEIAFWAMKSPTGKDLTLINYMIAPNNKRQDPAGVQRAVIALHGLQTDPYNYWGSAYGGLQKAKKINPDINDKSVALVAPYFPNGDDKNIGYPFTDGLPPGQGSNTTALVWQASRWASGDDNQYPHGTTLSSFTAIDNMIEYFNDASIYPNLKHIVIAGHSLGGQFVQRYALVGEQLNTRIPMTYWAGDPNSFAWLNSSRPINPSSNCKTYDDWRDGLSNYDVKYGSKLVAKGPAAVQKNFRTRRFVYARGLKDFGNDEDDCPPVSQGANRGTRFYNFLNFFRPQKPQFVDYFPNVGHDAPTIYNSRAGIQRFYLDNWDGTGDYSPDQGPRMLDFDNPNPDPDYDAKWGNYTGPRGTIDIPKPVPHAVPSVGAYSSIGCWTDSGNPRTLTGKTASANTVEKCATACDGFTYFGLEFGVECYCGNKIGTDSKQKDLSDCGMACGGNATETCGDASRLNMYQLSNTTTPANPASNPPSTSTSKTTSTTKSTTSTTSTTAITTTSSAVTSTSTTPTSTSTTATPTSTTTLSTSTSTTTSSTVTSTTTSATSSSTTATSSSSAPTTTSASTAGLAYVGCYTDASSRTLGRFVSGAANMTPKVCSDQCTAVGLKYAGIEYGKECYCGNSLATGTLVPDSECKMACAGDATVKCGAGWHLSVYTVA